MLLPKSFGLVAQFCTKALKPFLLKIIALLRYLLDNLFKLITIFLIVIFIYGIIGRIKEGFDGRIVSLEITMPPKHIEKEDGINEQGLANLLIYQLSLIDTKVATRRSGNKFTVVSSVKGSETTFKYQETSIPLNLLYSFFLRYVLRIEHKVIKGSVIEVGNETKAVIWLVGGQGKIFCLPTENLTEIDKKCTEIAEFCYKQIDPYRMALYYFQQHRDCINCIVKNGKQIILIEDIEIEKLCAISLEDIERLCAISLEDIEKLCVLNKNLEKSKKQADDIDDIIFKYIEYIEKLYALNKNLEKSKKITDDIIEKNPKDFWALNLKGLIFLELSDLADPQNLNNKKFIAKCHKDALEYFEDSIKMAEEARKAGKAKQPFSPPLTGMGHYYYELEKFGMSFFKYNKAIEEGENDAKAYLGKANSFLRVALKNYGENIEDREKNNFFCKSAQKVLFNPIQTQKYAIGFYNDAIKQFEDVGRARSKVTKSLDQLEKIVEILEKDEMIDNKKKDELINIIKYLDTLNPI